MSIHGLALRREAPAEAAARAASDAKEDIV